ncbi:MAG: hypothetical protein K2X32_15625 [Phycisphaerales bacterium]|nr:hypothetical protein [Phycisphaerales bacterium]
MATVIVLDSGGRLGNKLIHFAAVYAWCLHRGHRLFNPAFYAYAPLFPNLDSDLFLSGTHPLRLPVPMRRRLQKFALRLGRTASQRGWIHGEIHAESPTELVVLPPSEWLGGIATFDDSRGARFYLQGWYIRNPRGLTIYRKRIVELLSPSRDVIDDADAFARLVSGAEQSGPLEWGASRDTIALAVHIRQGDYKTERAGLYHDVGVYAQTMKRVQDELTKRSGKRVRFAVFSDEERTPQEFAPLGLDVVVSRSSVIGDLTRMSRFAGIIAAPSTFSQWAAYTANQGVGPSGVILEIGRHPDAELKYIEDEPIARDFDDFITGVMQRCGAS